MDALRKLIGLLSRRPKKSHASPLGTCPVCGMAFSHASENDAGGATRICNSCGERFDAVSAPCLEVHMAYFGDDAVIVYCKRDIAGTLQAARGDPELAPKQDEQGPLRDFEGGT